VSSAFLYVGIVAIWAFVLIPRWLRRPHLLGQTDGEADYPADPRDEHGDDEAANSDAADPTPHEPIRPAAAARSGQQLTRSRALQARRRLLTMLLLLTAAACACAGFKLTAWWACAPPAGMLGMYLLLLRQAALADAEQARRRAATAHAALTARRRAQRARPEPTAQIIDISARIGDQLYDQYADATVRAVGD